MTHRRLNHYLLVMVGEFAEELLVGSKYFAVGLASLTAAILGGVSDIFPLEIIISPTIELVSSRTGLPQVKQVTEGDTHQEIRLKFY